MRGLVYNERFNSIHSMHRKGFNHHLAKPCFCVYIIICLAHLIFLTSQRWNNYFEVANYFLKKCFTRERVMMSRQGYFLLLRLPHLRSERFL